MKVGVNVAIVEGNQILLTKRLDFEVWCLPGGHVDEGESVTQAAIRETLEETGLEVQLTGFIGTYMDRQALYQLRDESGLSSQEFYLRYFGLTDQSQDWNEYLNSELSPETF